MRTVAATTFVAALIASVVLAQGSDIPPKRPDTIPHGPLYVVDVTMDAKTGDVISRKLVSGPYNVESDCTRQQTQAGVSRPKVEAGRLTITITECSTDAAPDVSVKS